MRSFRIFFSFFFILFLFLSCIVCVQASPSVRYLHGRFQLENNSNGLLEVHNSTTVSKAWKYCQQLESCVSFGFQATARHPGANVTVSYYQVADWHVPSHLVDEHPLFVPDDAWHLYVNTTREQAMVTTEVQQVLDKLRVLESQMEDNNEITDNRPQASKSGRGLLRSLDSSNQKAATSRTSKKDRLLLKQEKAGWLLGLFGIAKYKGLRMSLVPTLTNPLIQIAYNSNEIDEIRSIALETLLALTDSYETPVVLQVRYHLLSHLQHIIQPANTGQKQPIDWGIVNSMALDLISNMALHRTKSDPFPIPVGLWDLLQWIAKTESGSAIGLQASLALIHLWGTGIAGSGASIDSIPESTLFTLLELLEATIDGDAVYGYDWDLMPGPLSAIHLIVSGSTQSTFVTGDESSSAGSQETNAIADMVDILLNAGLVEQLVRILDHAESLPSATTTLATLETLQYLRLSSPKAETVVAMVAATSIDETKHRLEEYEGAKVVAQTLTREVSSHKLHQGGGWMDDDNEL